MSNHNRFVEQMVERFTPIARRAMYKEANELTGDERIALAWAAGAEIKAVPDPDGYGNIRFVSVWPLGFLNHPATGKVLVVEKKPKEPEPKKSVILDQFGN